MTLIFFNTLQHQQTHPELQDDIGIQQARHFIAKTNNNKKYTAENSEILKTPTITIKNTTFMLKIPKRINLLSNIAQTPSSPPQ